MNNKFQHCFIIIILFIFTSCATVKYENNQKVNTASKPAMNPPAINQTFSQPQIGPLFAEKEKQMAIVNSENEQPYSSALKEKNCFTSELVLPVNKVTTNHHITEPLYETNTAQELNILQDEIDINTTDTTTISKPKHKKNRKYYILKAGFTKSLFNNSTGTLSESFPYTVTDLSTNVTTAKMLNGNIKYAFSSSTFIDLLNVELVSKKNCFDFGLGINSAQSNEYSIYFKTGYGYIVPINFIKWNSRPFLLFKPAVDVIFTAGYSKSFGEIDNNNKEINLLGYTADEQFTLGSGTDDDPYETYNSNALNINYKSSRTFVAPKISITNRPTRRFYCGVDASWFIPISQSNSVVLTQDDGDGHQYDVGSVGFNKKGTVTTLNNSLINKAPLIGGISISINAGVYLWPPKKVKPATATM